MFQHSPRTRGGSRPAVTVNYGLRWDIQRPFTPLSNAWSTTTDPGSLRRVGIGSGPGGRLQHVPAGQSGRRRRLRPELHGVHAGNAGYKTDWNNFAPNAGVAWRPNVQSGLLAGCSAIPTRRRSGPDTPSATGWSAWIGSRRSTVTIPAARSRRRATTRPVIPMLAPGETAPCCCATAAVSDRRRSRDRPYIR